MSRALCNVMKKVFALTIDESQSAFIPGHLIIDNIILGFETTHWIYNPRASKRSYVALKLDMRKVYFLLYFLLPS